MPSLSFRLVDLLWQRRPYHDALHIEQFNGAMYGDFHKLGFLGKPAITSGRSASRLCVSDLPRGIVIKPSYLIIKEDNMAIRGKECPTMLVIWDVRRVLKYSSWEISGVKNTGLGS